MQNADGVLFESINDVYGSKVPNLYKSAGNSFGFLTLQGGETLVPLDGQHRLAALEFAITGKDQRQQPIEGLGVKASVAEDTCTVILMRHDEERSRKIFNKVNRYAKPTTTAENLITADDDVVAVIVRESIIGTDSAIPSRLVNTKSNTLTPRSREFTTLSTLYASTKDLLEASHKKIRTDALPDQATKTIMQTEAVEFWGTICSEVNAFSDSLRDATETGDDRRREIRKDSLLGRPVAQWALVQSIMRLRAQDEISAARISLEDACKRVNQLDWSPSEPRWQQVLVSGDKMLTGKTVVNFSARVIAYWLGADMTTEEIGELNARYTSAGGTDRLAKPIALA